MPLERRTVEVIADWVGLGEPVQMGRLHATPSRGKEIFSFEYDRAWLGSEHALVVDPGLRLDGGPQHAVLTQRGAHAPRDLEQLWHTYDRCDLSWHHPGEAIDANGPSIFGAPGR